MSATSKSSLGPDQKALIEKAATALSSTAPVTEITRLVSQDVCDAILERYAAPVAEIGQDRARAAVATLLAGYPQATLKSRSSDDVFDMQAYSRTLARTIAKFPEYAVMGMIDRKPWGHPHLPSEPEIRAAMQDEVSRRAVIAANAKAHKREHDRLERQRAEDDRIAADRAKMTPEERAARADAIRSRLTIKQIEPEPPQQARTARPDLSLELAAFSARMKELEAQEGLASE